MAKCKFIAMYQATNGTSIYGDPKLIAMTEVLTKRYLNEQGNGGTVGQYFNQGDGRISIPIEYDGTLEEAKRILVNNFSPIVNVTFRGEQYMG